MQAPAMDSTISDSSAEDSASSDMPKKSMQAQTAVQELTRMVSSVDFYTRPARDTIQRHVGQNGPALKPSEQDMADEMEVKKYCEDLGITDGFTVISEDPISLPQASGIPTLMLWATDETDWLIQEPESDRRIEYYNLPLPGPICTKANAVCQKAADTAVTIAGVACRTAQGTLMTGMDRFVGTQFGLTVQEVVAGGLDRLPLRQLEDVRKSFNFTTRLRREHLERLKSASGPVVPPIDAIKHPHDAPEGSNIDDIPLYLTVGQHGTPRHFSNSFVDHEKRGGFVDGPLDDEETVDEGDLEEYDVVGRDEDIDGAEIK